jgi:hypothetical protein
VQRACRFSELPRHVRKLSYGYELRPDVQKKRYVLLLGGLHCGRRRNGVPYARCQRQACDRGYAMWGG